MFRLRELREEKGIGQKELGKLFNVAQNTISNWENGTREPDTKTLMKLAEFFECSVDYLVGRTDEWLNNFQNFYEWAMAIRADLYRFRYRIKNPRNPCGYWGPDL